MMNDDEVESIEGDEVVLASRVLLEYCDAFKVEIDLAEEGVFGVFHDSLDGRNISLNEILGAIEKSDRPHVFNIEPYYFLALLIPPFYFNAIFLEVLIGEILLLSSVFLFYKYAMPTLNQGRMNSYIRLRDPARVIEIVGDMVGFSTYVFREEGNRDNPIIRKIDGIMKTLNSLGGYLDIYTIRQLRYEVKKLEGLASLMAHIEITIDDLKELMLAPPEPHREAKSA